MASSITTTSILPAQIQQSFNYKILATPTPNLIYSIPAQKDRMPRNGGTTMRYSRYNPLNTALVPLGNSGVTPPAQNLTRVDLDARIDWYGTWLGLNEQTVLQNQDQVLNNAAIRLGVSLRETEDELIRNMLMSSASAINCVYGTNGDNPTNLTAEDISVVTRTLLGNNGYQFLSGIEGENKFGTAPVRSAYFALCHTDLTSDLESVNGFNPKDNYPAQNRTLDSEWGTVRNLRFLVSSVGAQRPNASDKGNTVYDITCVAKEAYATIDQDGASAQFIYLPAQYSGPLALNVTVGYKFAMVPRVLNDSWVLNLRATLLN